MKIDQLPLKQKGRTLGCLSNLCDVSTDACDSFKTALENCQTPQSVGILCDLVDAMFVYASRLEDMAIRKTREERT